MCVKPHDGDSQTNIMDTLAVKLLAPPEIPHFRLRIVLGLSVSEL